jgi:hypothetical protein
MDKVYEILKKDSVNDEDMKILMANFGSIPELDKVRLGLAPATAIEAAKEPVKPVEAPKEPVVEVPKEETPAEPEAPAPKAARTRKQK